MTYLLRCETCNLDHVVGFYPDYKLGIKLRYNNDAKADNDKTPPNQHLFGRVITHSIYGAIFILIP